MDVLKLAAKASELIHSFPRARIISHYDADGIASAGIICIALLRSGKDFRASMIHASDELDTSEDLTIFSDMGSGRSKEIEGIGKKVIICDHHFPNGDPSNAVHLNSHLCGMDGMSEACGASMSYALAIAIDEKNVDLAPLAIVGAIGDQQDFGGFKGYNKKILDEAIENGFIWIEKKNIGSIKEFIESSLDPFFKDFSGKKDSSLPILNELGIDADEKFEELEKEKRKRLLSMLKLRLLEQGVEEINLVKEIPYGRRYGDLSDLASILNACGRMGRSGIGVAISMGDEDKLNEGMEIRKRYRKKIMEGMLKLEKEGAEQMKNIRYFHAEKDMTGVLADLGIKYLFPKKPVLAISRGKEARISARATHRLVKEGINLAKAMEEAKKFGGNGGGHSIAAGASIPVEKEGEFLKKVDDAIGGMME